VENIINREVEASAAKMWDMRAHAFNRNQNKYKSKIPKNIVQYIKSTCGDIKSVLDVGGGAGRYSLEFGQAFEKVLVTDVSKNMLHYAKENATKKHLNNIDHIQFNWDTDTHEKITDQRFDLVFSSMCPATRSIEGLEKMMQFSKGYCAINQFIDHEDSFLTYIGQKEKISSKKEGKDPHKDRGFVQEAFNYLWHQGLTPEVIVFDDLIEITMTLEEAREYYFSHRGLRHIDEDKKMALSKAFFTKYHSVSLYNKSVLLLWKMKHKQ